jgi:hypothetical protein
MRKTLFIFAACLVVLFIIVCGTFRNSVRVVGLIKITAVFCGFTNDASGARLAAFRVSNQGGAAVYCWPTYSIEERGRASPLFWASFRGGASLAPAQSRIYALPAPTNAAAWRVVFNFSQESWRRKLAGLPPVVRWVVPSSALAVPVNEAISDWVGLEASSPPAAAVRQRVATVILPRPPILQPQTNANPNATPIKK